MEFTTLYASDVNGKTKVWTIKVDDKATISTSHGYQGMKMVTHQRTVNEGKNIGKKNETTPLEQAISEAKAAWNKKKDAGYTENCIENEEKFYSVLPMLALDYNKRGKSIKVPCFVQPKLDGTRCIGVPWFGLFSRNRKEYENLDHIKRELDKLKGLDAQLDGELYSETLSFQEIVGLVKKQKLTKEDEKKQKQIFFYVYDLVNDQPFEQRLTLLSELFLKNKFKYIRPVQTEVCINKDDLPVFLAKYIEDGYEGLMIRNRDGAYQINGRSADLQKYKLFEDKEYEITDYKEGDGVEKGLVIWICKTEDNKTFSVRPKGTHEQRSKLFETGKNFIGKMLTVKFQELTNDGIPRFPVGISIRDYE